MRKISAVIYCLALAFPVYALAAPVASHGLPPPIRSTAVEWFRILGSTFPAVVGWVTLFLAYSGIALVFEPKKYNRRFALIWPAVSVGWAYFVEVSRLSNFMAIRYSVLEQIISFEAWFILPPLIVFIGYSAIKKIKLNHLVIEALLAFFVLNIAYLAGLFSVVVALAVVDL